MPDRDSDKAREGLERAVIEQLSGGTDLGSLQASYEFGVRAVLDRLLDPSNRALALGAMGMEGWDLLNLYTKEVLAEAAAVAPTLPAGRRLFVNASTGVSLNRDDGHWVGFSREGGLWHAYCGSLLKPEAAGVCYPSLAEAVGVFAEGDGG